MDHFCKAIMWSRNEEQERYDGEVDTLPVHARGYSGAYHDYQLRYRAEIRRSPHTGRWIVQVYRTMLTKQAKDAAQIAHEKRPIYDAPASAVSLAAAKARARRIITDHFTEWQVVP